MAKPIIKTPFFVLNPKSYLYGEKLLQLAKVADQLAHRHNLTIFVTAPYADIPLIAKNTSYVLVTAQHIDGISCGRGMGSVLPYSLKEAGAVATFLNHAERPLTVAQLAQSIDKAKELDMVTIACADTIAEAKAISMFNPDIVLCEPTELIGTGKTSDDSYIEQTNEAIKSVNSSILVMQAAGISSADDVYRTILLGADGTGCTSGIVCAKDPKQALTSMVEALIKANIERS